jgi:hypothetical protein
MAELRTIHLGEPAPERDVKVPAAQAIADQADADRCGHDGTPPRVIG